MTILIAGSQTEAKAIQLVASAPRTISDLLADGEFYDWQSEQIDSGGWATTGTQRRDRYNRCYDAAENGGDGSTHQEHIDDFREYANHVYRNLNRELSHLCDELTQDQQDTLQDDLDSAQESLVADCDRCEAWHEQNGSLDQQIG